METLSDILAWRIPQAREAWWAGVSGVTNRYNCATNTFTHYYYEVGVTTLSLGWWGAVCGERLYSFHPAVVASEI